MPDRPTDEELIRAWRAGEADAFDRLVERHMKRIYALAFRLTGSHDAADDLAQESFIRAHRGLSRFRGEARFGTWLTRILLNLARNPRRSFLPLTTAPEPVTTGQGALMGLIDDERRKQVRAAVSTLPEKQRQTLLLRLYEGLRFREIAGVLGTTTGTAKANFFHAVRGVARRLAPEDGP
ncbi:MAG: RNA polymerase sigma factor [Acidobacteriota bacterium]